MGIEAAERAIRIAQTNSSGYLDLSNQNLTTKDLEKLIPIIDKKTRVLNLSNNPFTIFPESIVELIHLKHLEIS